MGYMLCSFNGSSLETRQNGAKISFHTVSLQHGKHHVLTDTSYDECLTATFQICKNPCIHNHTEISVEEERELMRWLNRRSFKKFKLLDDEHMDLYFEAGFNVSRIELAGRLRGFELEMITNRPFALQEQRHFFIHNTAADEKHVIYDTSDEEGYLYPHVEIRVLSDTAADLTIHNDYDNRITSISNCSKDEVITMDYPIIQTSSSEHKIEKDFNWNFLRIGNTSENRKNTLTVSRPCEIKITYAPIAKIGI